jgi:hypothetical protein
MKPYRALAAVLLVTVLVAGYKVEYATSAGFNDPLWPCQQRKVAELSLGIMWTEPLPENFDPARPGDLSSEAEELAALLSLRKISLEEAEVVLAKFAQDNQQSDTAQMLAVFARVFGALGDTRRRVISGIEKYSLKQIALSERIDAARSQMRVLEDAKNPDFDKIDALEEQIDWDERIFRDRDRSLTYVCETPVLIEKRLYALAQLLMKYSK